MADSIPKEVIVALAIAFGVAILNKKVNDLKDSVIAPFEDAGDAISGAIDKVKSAAGSVKDVASDATKNTARVTTSGGQGVGEFSRNVYHGFTGQETERTQKIDPAVFLATVPKKILTPEERADLTWVSAGLNRDGFGPTGGSTARLTLAQGSTFDYATVPPVIEHSLALNLGKSLYNSPMPIFGWSPKTLSTALTNNFQDIGERYGPGRLGQFLGRIF
jgi:hypothetical protein